MVGLHRNLHFVMVWSFQNLLCNNSRGMRLWLSQTEYLLRLAHGEAALCLLKS
jgi:hypothetical protein